MHQHHNRIEDSPNKTTPVSHVVLSDLIKRSNGHSCLELVRLIQVRLILQLYDLEI